MLYFFAFGMGYAAGAVTVLVALLICMDEQ
jgi:hypothetical protein